ncbi:hypothetical protein ACN2XU_05470 [Primorskyibacter sp. 2E107]|uniref:hypothetical protein n=1 Tax=Primorskyibacter sp. 2E107 TaxID=3403458 RepID=UPI003AF89EDF
MGAKFGKGILRGSVLALTAVALSGCASPVPGPSVPSQPGKNLASARGALQACLPSAPEGGENALAASYLVGMAFGGVLLGPIVVASNQADIRYGGEVHAIDRCLGKQGYVRRDLTVEEVRALNGMDRTGRARLLDHLIGGGTLAGFRSV